ncbi:MAG: hypothetical protein ABS35_19990 [Kaistia sp. SCN 65-12]|nr:MAG: hypothetical protein ABS35_19990 [Kaistia sp. SCN 65-12]
MTRHVVIGISGASGAALGLRILERLGSINGVQRHLVITVTAEKTLRYEVGDSALAQAWDLAEARYNIEEVGSRIASGSFRTAGMIVAPCSMRTLSAIAHGMSDNLLTRAADVHLKERRRLVLLTRETPLHLGHIRSMLQATQMGAIVAPPVPAFYLRPATVEDIVDALAARAIDLLDLGTSAQSVAWDGL